MQLKIFLVTLLFCTPHIAAAAVVITEIAWMGTTISANDEWIELYNAGSNTVSLDGWVLEDGMSLAISLSGNLAPNQYAVLERTDDASAPGAAFLIYTGALANTGATLILKNSAGTIVDQVAGGENWEAVGGDNTTKETAQYTQGGWITAPSTPGMVNAMTDSKTIAGSQVDTEKSSSAGSVQSKVYEKVKTLVPSSKKLSLVISAPEVMYVNQAVELSAVPGAIGDNIMDSLQYEWNLGDLNTYTGKTISHTYKYPGEYIVSLRAHYARHDDTIQVPVMVLPVKLSLTQNRSGDINVHNDSPYDINVSGFVLRGEASATFPDRSFIPQNGTVTIPNKKIGGLKFNQAHLFDRNGMMLAVLSPIDNKEIQTTVPVVSNSELKSNDPPLVESTNADFSFAKPAQTDVLSEKSIQNSEEIKPSLTAAAGATGQVVPDSWPLFGLFGIIILGLVSVYAGSQKS